MSNTLDAEIRTLEENIDPQTQADMDRFYAAYKKTYDLPKDVAVLPRLLQLLKQPDTLDNDHLKMDIVHYVLEFDRIVLAQTIAYDASDLAKNAYQWAIFLFHAVLIKADMQAVIKQLYGQLEDENKNAIIRMFNDIIYSKEVGFDFSAERQEKMRQIVRDITMI